MLVRRYAKLVFLLLLLPALLLGGLGIKNSIIMPSFQALEKDEAVKAIQRCTDAIERERYHLGIFIKDWSVWDDAYKFAQDKNTDFIKSNLDWNVMENKLKVNLVYICDLSGKVVWGGIHDSDLGGTLTLQSFHGTDLGKGHIAIRNVTPEKDTSGYLVTEYGPMFLVSSSILPTSGKGAPVGFMIMGRFLDQEVVKSLNEQTKTQFSIDILSLDQGSEAASKPGNAYPLNILNEKTLTVSDSLFDLYRAHRLQITAQIPRLIYQYGTRVANYILIATLIIYTVIVVFFLLLLRIVKKFTRLRKKDVIMSALASSANILITDADLGQGLAAVLGNIGDATRVSRVYIYENQEDEGSGIGAMLKVDWDNVAEGAAAGRCRLTHFRYQEAGLERWEQALSRRNVISGNVEDFEGAEQETLKSLGVRSIAVVPIFIHNRWWGFIGLTECKGRRLWTPSELEALRLAAGTVGGAIERQRIESALKAAKEEAEAATRSKGDFLANMSHEIRTPMNGVLGMADLLMNTPLETKQCKYAKNIKASGEALLTVINDVLDFSKIEAGQLDLEEVDFDLFEMVNGVMDMVAIRASEKQLELLCHIHDEVPQYVGGDPSRLRQVLTNLVGNAIKFTPLGEVSVQVRLERQTLDEVVLRFSINDTGIGISAAQQEKIFNAFVQADSSVSRRFGGTGLGLSISRHLAQLMGGELGVESEVGQGSRFWFTVVLKKRIAAAPKILPGSITGKRAIVVDDNQTNREILLSLLSRWGCQVYEAPDGYAALREIGEAQDRGLPYNLAIIDFKMPGMSGVQLAERIRSDGRHEALRLIMLTSISAAENTNHYVKKRIDAHLTKPVKPAELLETIEWVLGKLAMEQRTDQQNAVSAAGADRAGTERPIHKYRLLLAEDNEINQDLILEIFNGVGLTAEVARDGEEAVAAYVRNPAIDLIVMDCQMPRLSGYDATARIRAMESVGRHVPIIAVTANAMKGERERCLAAGMDDYLTKPVVPGQLIDKVLHWLEMTRAHGVAVPAMGERFNPDKPSESAPESGSPSGAPAPVSAASRGRILLAEDDDVLREVGLEILMEAGFQVDLASDGLRAVELACLTAYDAILMDGSMPRMDGIAATRQIRKSGSWNGRVPIIAVTGADEDLKHQLPEIGLNDYLIKPYDIELLIAKIAYWISKRREEDNPAQMGHDANMHAPGSPPSGLCR